MEIGLGVLGLTSDAFWSLTYQEFTAAIDGYQEKNNTRKSTGPTLEEAEQLKRAIVGRSGEKVSDDVKELFRKNGRSRPPSVPDRS